MVGFLKGFIVFFQLEQIFVDILLFVDFDQHTGNVGTMVGNAFDIGEQILIDLAQFHGAFFVLQPLDVAVFQFQIQGVD